MSILIAGGRVITASDDYAGDVFISDGRISLIGRSLDVDADRVARLQNYFFNPDFIAEVCGELGLRWRSNGYRWSTDCERAASPPEKPSR